ncbi:hypothetical protein [Halovivax limisalsi]|uniref:hypothetical protein n=1 Tax=Halovivax limisalsi TaxID=1453760 RepID=UPI001FFD6CED|nr:hypothetical protein [Halovivax limisalsi]
MGDSELHRLIDDTRRYSDRDELEIEEYRSLTRALNEDVHDVIVADRSFFVLGSYNDEEKTRLERARDRLFNEGHAFLMDDTYAAWEYWTTQFKIYADRATHIVGIYEHTDGGHEWEAGYLDHTEYRSKTYILKRRYPELDPREEPFDGMMAHYMLLASRRDQLIEWDGAADAPMHQLDAALDRAIDSFLDSID